MDYGKLIGIVSERPRNFAWLLGAGTSRSAGLPTATDILWDLKRRYYCREENQEVTQQDIQNGAVRSKIQAYMISKGFPALWADNEYSIYFERIFGDDYERQSAYLSAMLSEKRVALSVGCRALGALIAAEQTRAIFTTNFDTVVEKAVAEVSGKSMSAFHLEGSYAASDALDNEQYPLYVKLHGDFRYRSIKNLTADLASQNVELGRCFINACNRFGLIVTGYSGRDASVMELLKSVLQTSNPFPHGLYWTGLTKSYIPAPVKELFEVAEKRGVKTHYITIETFDAFLLRLWRNIPNKPTALNAKVRKTQYAAVNIPVPTPLTSGKALRINAVPVSLPTHCLALQLKSMVDWAAIQDAEQASLDELILTKAESVLMWGKRSVAEALFKGNVVDFKLEDISAQVGDLKNHLYLKAFIEKALGRALVRNKPLLCRNAYHRTFLVADRFSKDQAKLASVSKIVGSVHGEIRGALTVVSDKHPRQDQVSWAEAVQISVEEKNGQYWLILDPDIWIWPRRAKRDVTEFLDGRRGDRFNAKTDHLTSAWSQILFEGATQGSIVELKPFGEGDESENPTFQIEMGTTFSRQRRA